MGAGTAAAAASLCPCCLCAARSLSPPARLHVSPPHRPAPPPQVPACGSAPQTQLKYAVEVVIPRATRMLGVLEPLLERTVFEDVPANLAAIKQRVESMQVGRGRRRAGPRVPWVGGGSGPGLRGHALRLGRAARNRVASSLAHCSPLLPSLPQAEMDICQLEAAGEVAAAASLRKKLERPALAGAPLLQACHGLCGSSVPAPTGIPPLPCCQLLQQQWATHPSPPLPHPLQTWWTTFRCWWPSWSAALAPSVYCPPAASCAR